MFFFNYHQNMKTFEFVAISHLVTPMHLVFQDTLEPQ